MTEEEPTPAGVDTDQDVISRILAGERDAFAMLIGR